MNELLEVKTLGGVSVFRDGQPVKGIETRSGIALVVYLACTARPFPREVLAEFLWENRPQGNARSILRGVLSNLRREVGPFVDFPSYGDTVAMNFDSDIRIDVHDFEVALDGAESGDMAALESALAIYQGDFLDGFFVDSEAFEDWARHERERLQLRAMEAFDRLVTCYGREGDFQAAINVLKKHVLPMDPTREESHRQLMIALANADQRTAALAQYDICCEALADIGADPAPETTAIYEQIRSGTFPQAEPDVRPLAPPAPPDVIPAPGKRQRCSDALFIRTVHGVPPRAERLVGRDPVLGEIEGQLARGQRVLLQGFSGVGKTVLAAEAVARHIEAGRGAVIWLTVGTEDAESLVDALARPFEGHAGVVARQGPAKLQAVRNLLAEHQVTLAVLDDVWEGPTLKLLLEALPHRLPVLVTSRHRIGIGPILEINELALAEALELLSFHACRDYGAREPDAVALVETLGLHPFGVEIAGKTLLVDDLQPAELLQRIGDEPHVLKMPAWFNHEGRESVKHLLDVSVNALSRPASDVFFGLGALFTAYVTPDLMARCLHVDQALVTEQLTELSRRGLARRTRLPCSDLRVYHAHDMAYSYARANAMVPRQDVLEACDDYITRHVDDVPALETEIGNLLGAAEEAQHTDPVDTFVPMMSRLAIEANYFEACGYSPRVLALIQRAAEVAAANGELNSAHYLLCKLGNAYSRSLGQFERAVEAYQAALELAQALDDTNRQATALTLIGTTRYRQGADDPDEYYDRAYALATEHDDTAALGFILSHRSYYAGTKTPPDYPSCLRYANESVELAARVGAHESQWASLLNRAVIECDMGLFDQALASNDAAYQLAQTHHNRIWEAAALHGMGEVYHAMGDRARAESHLQHALALYRQNGDTQRERSLLAFLEKGGYGPSSV